MVKIVSTAGIEDKYKTPEMYLDYCPVDERKMELERQIRKRKKEERRRRRKGMKPRK